MRMYYSVGLVPWGQEGCACESRNFPALPPGQALLPEELHQVTQGYAYPFAAVCTIQERPKTDYPDIQDLRPDAADHDTIPVVVAVAEGDYTPEPVAEPVEDPNSVAAQLAELQLAVAELGAIVAGGEA